MSEFIEIGKNVYRLSEVMRARPCENRTVVDFVNYGADTFNEPYESVRDKLVGKPPKPSDQVKEFVDRLVDFMNAQKQHHVAYAVANYYQSTMLSETEGAG